MEIISLYMKLKVLNYNLQNNIVEVVSCNRYVVTVKFDSPEQGVDIAEYEYDRLSTLDGDSISYEFLKGCNVIDDGGIWVEFPSDLEGTILDGVWDTNPNGSDDDQLFWNWIKDNKFECNKFIGTWFIPNSFAETLIK